MIKGGKYNVHALVPPVHSSIVRFSTLLKHQNKRKGMVKPILFPITRRVRIWSYTVGGCCYLWQETTKKDFS